ncbi:MAG: glucose-6-phosphate dehydrogenase [Bacteroidetes bacterium]|nr:MAG: glucose-6-phosphate dehydrogenase [Bacteroidota bacterium]
MPAPTPLLLTIFGASGDLAYRKLIPALYDLSAQDLLPAGFAVLGVSRTEYSDAEFRDRLRAGIEEFAHREVEADALDRFLQQVYYQPLNTHEESDYAVLKERQEALAKVHGTEGNVIYYLSTPPSLYRVIPSHLAAHGLHQPEEGWCRLIVEKPFGYDLESGKALNDYLLSILAEDQIYRIDHYLGKETVQNLLVTRFSNGIFEPLWNRNYIHHVEITAAESLGVGDRGGYYDSSGALRDMIQNHLLQVMGLVAMEPPTVVEADAIRNEVLKVFQALRPIREEDVATQVIRGQYVASHIRGEAVKGYREEKGVSPDSRTPTYVALKAYVDNWRWGGVPFYIRTGKRLPTRATEVVIHFRETPHRLFADLCGLDHLFNQLVIRIQPNEGMLLKLGMKLPGMGFRVEHVNMDFLYKDMGANYVPSAYERLLLDAMQGDATLYARGDAVEAAWRFVDPILKAWAHEPDLPVYGYPAGSWGPENADTLIEGEGYTWRYPAHNLADDGVYCEL